MFAEEPFHAGRNEFRSPLVLSYLPSVTFGVLYCRIVIGLECQWILRFDVARAIYVSWATRIGFWRKLGLLFLCVPTVRGLRRREVLRRMVPRDGVEPPTPAFSGLRSTT